MIRVVLLDGHQVEVDGQFPAVDEKQNLLIGNDDERVVALFRHDVWGACFPATSAVNSLPVEEEDAAES